MKGMSASKIIKSAGAPGVILPLGKPSNSAGFNVIVFMGAVVLDPPSDNWTRTIYVENVRQE